MSAIVTRSDLGLTGLLVAASAAVLAMPPGSADPCYVQTWFDPYTTTGNGCVSYDKCPTRVLCALGTVDDEVSEIGNAAVNCERWIQGTLMPDGSCVGGSYLGPSTTTVTVPYQDCFGGC
jgi:hypothetical protein